MISKLEKQDVTKSGKYFRILLTPIWLLLEYICYRKYWHKIVVPELITNDEIFNFLNRNDFEYRKKYFIKKDLIDDNEKISGKSLEEAKQVIKKDFVEALTNLISANCSVNIEDFISLLVETDLEVIKNQEEYFSGRVYSVKIQFYRLWWLQKAKKYTFIWLLIFLNIVAGIFVAGITAYNL